MDISKEFNIAVEKINNLKERPDDDTLLHLYALYKQATIGDNNTPQPGHFSVKNKLKWNSWNELNGMLKEKAMNNYIRAAKKL